MILVLIVGILFSLLTIINYITTTEITPALERSEILSALSSVLIILIYLLSKGVSSKKEERSDLSSNEGFYLKETINSANKFELAWGSQMILTATAASTVLVYWDGETILRRGLITQDKFEPKEVCLRAKSKGSLISLVNTKFYPGKTEFDPIVKDLPAVIIVPLLDNGYLVVGGWSARCFTKSDEKWITGWSDRLTKCLIDNKIK
nr:cofactor assembly of complex C subunit B [Prochlorococcus marinus]